MAFGTVNIEGKDFTFRSSSATEVFYKQVFGEDLLVSFMAASEYADIDTENISPEQAAELTEQTADMVKVGFIMSMQAENTKARKFQELTEMDYYDWLDTIPNLEPEKLTEIINIYLEGKKTSVTPKKEGAKPKE